MVLFHRMVNGSVNTVVVWLSTWSRNVFPIMSTRSARRFS